jgi:hypothetical protein
MEPLEPNSLEKHMGQKKKRPIPPKDDSQVWCPLKKFPWSWTHIVPTYMHKSFVKTCQKRQEKKGILFTWDKKVDKLHMKLECPKQLKCLPREEDHQYVPCLEIKLHLKNAWQSFKNPLAHPKHVSHLWPKCNLKESLCLERSLINSKACTLTPWT